MQNLKRNNLEYIVLKYQLSFEQNKRQEMHCSFLSVSLLEYRYNAVHETFNKLELMSDPIRLLNHQSVITYLLQLGGEIIYNKNFRQSEKTTLMQIYINKFNFSWYSWTHVTRRNMHKIHNLLALLNRAVAKTLAVRIM
jgi:hypothetical protein